jgi:hypothetical protein
MNEDDFFRYEISDSKYLALSRLYKLIDDGTIYPVKIINSLIIATGIPLKCPRMHKVCMK